MLEPKVFHSGSEDETAQIAAAIAADIKAGDILFLHGPLGMGKSVFARALIRTLAGQPDLDVPSPTFTLVQHYDTPLAPLWHFDLYRLEDPDEVYETGWEEALDGGIVVVEWPQRLGYLAPARRRDITLSKGKRDENSRIITIAQPEKNKS